MKGLWFYVGVICVILLFDISIFYVIWHFVHKFW